MCNSWTNPLTMHARYKRRKTWTIVIYLPVPEAYRLEAYFDPHLGIFDKPKNQSEFICVHILIGRLSRAKIPSFVLNI